MSKPNPDCTNTIQKTEKNLHFVKTSIFLFTKFLHYRKLNLLTKEGPVEKLQNDNLFKSYLIWYIRQQCN